MIEESPYIINQTSTDVDWSNTCLQSLNRRIVCGDKKVLLQKELFEESVDKWTDIPVIFQEEGRHPDLMSVYRDPSKAAEDVGGRVIGVVKNPRIETEGHPRLMAALDVYDERAEELFIKGELGLSTGFTAHNDGDRLLSAPAPNHVLLFREVVDLVEPIDNGAFVNTTAPYLTNESQNIRPIETIVMEETVDTPEQVSPNPDLSQELAQKNEEIAALKAQLDAANLRADEIQAKLTETETKLAAVTAELDSYKTAESDRKFEELLDQLPEGMVSTDEFKNSLRKELEVDPISAALKIAKARSSNGETSHIGDAFVNSRTNAQVELGNLSPHALNMR